MLVLVMHGVEDGVEFAASVISLATGVGSHDGCGEFVGYDVFNSGL